MKLDLDDILRFYGDLGELYLENIRTHDWVIDLDHIPKDFCLKCDCALVSVLHDSISHIKLCNFTCNEIIIKRLLE